MASYSGIDSKGNRYELYLALGALGVVFGDIGTSPLYALRECFSGSHAIEPTPEHVLGVLSLIFWSLIAIVWVQYLVVVMRADNHGEGGALALLALLCPKNVAVGEKRWYLLLVGLTGTSLLYADGSITPAISVLSAVEGLKVATPYFENYVIPLTVLILSALFFMQKQGTGSLGRIFGPVMLVWFSVLFVLGARGIFIYSREVIWAVNPWYALRFLWQEGTHGLYTLGAVFLVITGAEALYADMGHFGKQPIARAWRWVVLPGLAVNYFGQGALLLASPEARSNPFYHLAPSWSLYPLVGLATLATVIASQALISGAFSITRQAFQLGYLPRLQTSHTSSKEIGQIYIGYVNVVLWAVTTLLVLSFKSSSNLAAAYGIAVSVSIVTTMTLVFFVTQLVWRWKLLTSLLVCGVFLVADLAFFGANLIKVAHGGWVPLLMGAVMFIIMTTWYRGRQIVADRLAEQVGSLEDFLAPVRTSSVIRIPGTAVFMSRSVDKVPVALVHNVRHNKVIHKTTIFLAVQTEEIPYVGEYSRVELEELGDGFYRMIVHYGYMESPDIPRVLERYRSLTNCTVAEITFFFGRETLIPTAKPGMAIWREKLFAVMTSNAQQATTFFKIAPEQVILIGFEIEI